MPCLPSTAASMAPTRAEMAGLTALECRLSSCRSGTSTGTTASSSPACLSNSSAVAMDPASAASLQARSSCSSRGPREDETCSGSGDPSASLGQRHFKTVSAWSSAAKSAFPVSSSAARMAATWLLPTLSLSCASREASPAVSSTSTASLNAVQTSSKSTENCCSMSSLRVSDLARASEKVLATRSVVASKAEDRRSRTVSMPTSFWKAAKPDRRLSSKAIGLRPLSLANSLSADFRWASAAFSAMRRRSGGPSGSGGASRKRLSS
mmetsp:Transcript_104459/g.311927  ORF Transcript_104459/g.311927 Transcript_104459/m.311927 type:complete len:266 (-) Transcript_104459:612-1409(-)